MKDKTKINLSTKNDIKIQQTHPNEIKPISLETTEMENNKIEPVTKDSTNVRNLSTRFKDSLKKELTHIENIEKTDITRETADFARNFAQNFSQKISVNSQKNLASVKKNVL